jgi:hypothetical protein
METPASDFRQPVGTEEVQEAESTPPAPRACSTPGCGAKPLRGGLTCWFHGDRSKRRRKPPSSPAAPPAPIPPNPWAPANLEEVKQALLTVSKLAVAGKLDRGTAVLVSSNLKTLLAHYEKAGSRGSAEGANGLPAGARPLTPDEDEYVQEHGAEPPGIRIGYYAIENPEPESGEE